MESSFTAARGIILSMLCAGMLVDTAECQYVGKTSRRLMQAGLLLPLATAAACSGPMGCLQLKQLSADKWTFFDGKPTRQNIFCHNTLSALTRTTPDAARALDALCNDQDQSSLFSRSALDTWMAARFINYNTSLNGTASERPLSTEPNTPWMLADVVLTTSQVQKRADSWRKVRGDAQLDLMLCSDPTCKVVVDLVKVQRPGQPAPKEWHMATSGITTATFQTGTGTAAGLDNAELHERKSWVPPDLAEGSQMHVQEVVWQTSSGVLVDTSSHSCGLHHRIAIINATAFAIDTRMASQARPIWGVMNIGHYKTTDALLPYDGECVTVIWPNHTWLFNHGWGKSDPECAGAYTTMKLNFCNTTAQPRIFAIDSMLPQAHLLRRGGNITRTFNRNQPSMPSILSEGEYVTNETVAVVMSYNTDADPSDAVVMRYKALADPSASDAQLDRKGKEYLQLAGRMGGTLAGSEQLAADGYFLTQSYTGCVAACPTPDLYCGQCELLQVGTATFAAVPVWQNLQFAGREYNLSTLTALRKLHYYSTLFADKEGPWCNYTWSLGYDNPVSVLLPIVTDPSLYAPLSERRGGNEFDLIEKWPAASVVPNCSWWDSMGVGFVARPGKKDLTAVTLADEFEVIWWQTGGNEYDQAISLIAAPHDDNKAGYGYMAPDGLKNAADQVVAEAVQLLNQKVAQALATTDSTKTGIGALLDMTVIVLGIVAMASGRREGEAWIAEVLANGANRICCTQVPTNGKPSPSQQIVGKVLYCCVIVPLGLVLAPAIVLKSDVLARRDNANGDSSELGWLSREVQTDSSRYHLSPSKYILVGVVSIRTTTEYDPVAQSLLLFNLALALAGMLSIMCASVCCHLVGKKGWELPQRRSSASVGQGGWCSASMVVEM